MASPFECPICLEIFNDNEFKPLIIYCGHTLCSSCLAPSTSSQLLECPICKNPIDAELELRVNYALIASDNQVGEYAKQKKINSINTLLEQEQLYLTDIENKFLDSQKTNEDTIKQLNDIKAQFLAQLEGMIAQVHEEEARNQEQLDQIKQEVEDSANVKRSAIDQIQSGSTDVTIPGDVGFRELDFTTKQITSSFNPNSISFQQSERQKGARGARQFPKVEEEKRPPKRQIAASYEEEKKLEQGKSEKQFWYYGEKKFRKRENDEIWKAVLEGTNMFDIRNNKGVLWEINIKAGTAVNRPTDPKKRKQYGITLKSQYIGIIKMNADLERMIQDIYAELDELRISTSRSAITNESLPWLTDPSDNASWFERHSPPLGDNEVSEQVTQEDDCSKLPDIHQAHQISQVDTMNSDKYSIIVQKETQIQVNKPQNFANWFWEGQRVPVPDDYDILRKNVQNLQSQLIVLRRENAQLRKQDVTKTVQLEQENQRLRQQKIQEQQVIEDLEADIEAYSDAGLLKAKLKLENTLLQQKLNTINEEIQHIEPPKEKHESDDFSFSSTPTMNYGYNFPISPQAQTSRTPRFVSKTRKRRLAQQMKRCRSDTRGEVTKVLIL